MVLSPKKNGQRRKRWGISGNKKRDREHAE